MKPIIIGIGGSKSSAGKTTLACRLLSVLKGWGAIKYTRTSFYSSIIDDPGILRQKGKDTSRLLRAGAEEVLWVKSPREGLKEPLQIARQRLKHLKGIIVEGNSAIEVLRPDVVIFISKGNLKAGAENILKMADIVIEHAGVTDPGVTDPIEVIKGLIDECKRVNDPNKRDAG